jgi:DNA-binding MarR family transcriptional regulator
MTQLDVLGIIRAAQHLERNASIALMYSGLRISQYRLLELVDGCEEPTVTEMGRQLNITRASASVMVNELSRAGIVYLEENPSDRRSFHIRISTLGRNKLKVARRDLAVFLEKISARYPLEMLQAINRFARESERH